MTKPLTSEKQIEGIKALIKMLSLEEQEELYNDIIKFKNNDPLAFAFKAQDELIRLLRGALESAGLIDKREEKEKEVEEKEEDEGEEYESEEEESEDDEKYGP